MREACFFQRLAQQKDIVGGTTAAAGLADDEGCVLQIILAAFQCVDKLAYDQQRRIADVVIYIFQACFNNLTASILQNFCLVAAARESGLQQGEVQREHTGNKNSMRAFHILGEGSEVNFIHAKKLL